MFSLRNILFVSGTLSLALSAASELKYLVLLSKFVAYVIENWEYLAKELWLWIGDILGVSFNPEYAGLFSISLSMFIIGLSSIYSNILEKRNRLNYCIDLLSDIRPDNSEKIQLFFIKINRDLRMAGISKISHRFGDDNYIVRPEWDFKFIDYFGLICFVLIISTQIEIHQTNIFGYFLVWCISIVSTSIFIIIPAIILFVIGREFSSGIMIFLTKRLIEEFSYEFGKESRFLNEYQAHFKSDEDLYTTKFFDSIKTIYGESSLFYEYFRNKMIRFILSIAALIIIYLTNTVFIFFERTI